MAVVLIQTIYLRRGFDTVCILLELSLRVQQRIRLCVRVDMVKAIQRLVLHVLVKGLLAWALR